MILRGIRLFPLGSIVLSAAVAGAQVAPAAVPADADDAVSAVATPAPAPVYPKRPAELPPQPPKVTCRGNDLTISANNSTLQEILQAVKGCTGAKIEIPDGAVRVRSFEELGPGPVRSVLDELLSGTPYNYVIQSSDTNPLKVETVMLSMRGSDDKPGSNSLPADLPATTGRKLWQHMQKFDKPDPSQLNEDGTLIDADAAAAAQAETPLPTQAPQPDAPASTGTASEASATAAAEPPAAPVAPPVVNPGSSSDPSQAITDRITQMQQMFSQRQQMVKQQNQGQTGSPNN